MARFVAILLVAPWLTILSWLYWLYARRHTGGRISAGFDVAMLVAAWLAAIVCALVAYHFGASYYNPIWKQMFAAWVAYPGYAVVLFWGWLRHWRAGATARA
ncbi:MAG TPA: hypothetical protein VF264_00600 [Rhodanobacteraceae bacterium]